MKKKWAAFQIWAVATLCLPLSLMARQESEGNSKAFYALKFKTETAIKYVVVIVPENRSFDHFFGTYPHALNPPGEPLFKPKRNTPQINGLNTALFTLNQNLNPPFRLSPAEAVTCNPAHHYSQLQNEARGGLMDNFIQTNPKCAPTVMGYYDGNTVTALWNYAQRFAMSDNFFSTCFTPSAPGAVNIISGQTHGATPPNLSDATEVVTVDGTLIADPDPTFDKCSIGPTVALTGTNVGHLLNDKSITWGWFAGGFRDCNKTHLSSTGQPIADYQPHHQPFQFYLSTSNPQHLPPSSKKMIGFQDQANHQYDLEDFWAAANIHNLPAVSFLKPASYQDCHPNYSDPLAFQTFLVETVNKLQKMPEWKQMAIFIVFDDSGGWYDHVMPPIINHSQTPEDVLVPNDKSGTNPPFGGYQGRLAYGMRLPFLIISPFAKRNFVDHTINDQTSVLRFIEDNWNLGRIGNYSFDELAGSLANFFDFDHPHYKPIILDPKTGLVKKKHSRVPFSSH